MDKDIFTSFFDLTCPLSGGARRREGKKGEKGRGKWAKSLSTAKYNDDL